MIGTSIGLRARSLDWTVVAWDERPESLLRACERGAVSAPAASLANVAAASGVLVLATPLDATLALLRGFAAAPPGAELILDVASVKVPVALAGAPAVRFVATHPIAGSERSGPEAARADLFTGRIWTYDAAAPPELGHRAAAFIEAMGAAAVAVENSDHDRIVALTSHLPQLLAVALGARLAERLDEPGVSSLCGTGMRSMLRLAASAWPVWGPIFSANALPVAREARGLAEALLRLAAALESGRCGEIEEAFVRAAPAAARLEANGSLPQDVDLAYRNPDERRS